MTGRKRSDYAQEMLAILVGVTGKAEWTRLALRKWGLQAPSWIIKPYSWLQMMEL